MKTLLLAILKRVVKNIAAMAVSKKMVYWTLETWANNTKNKIDDNIVQIVEGAYDGNQEQLQRGVDGLLKELNKDKPESGS